MVIYMNYSDIPIYLDLVNTLRHLGIIDTEKMCSLLQSLHDSFQD
jgi:hypothetical protein